MTGAQPICALSHASRGGQFAAPCEDRMWAWGFRWDAARRLVDRLDPRGVRVATSYTAEGWTDEITYSYPGLPDETVDYRVYDDLGNPQRIDFPEGTTQPRNDARSQVVLGSYGLSGTNEDFRYDDDGNRVFHKRAGVSRDLVVDAADQLNEVRRETDGALLEQFFYDNAGRRIGRVDNTSGVVTGYAYDALGRLTAVVDTTGYELSLEYDPLGGRIRRTETQPSEASETTLFLSGLLELRDVDAAGQAGEVVRWIQGPGPGGVVAEVSAGPSASAPVIWSLLGDAAHNVVRMAQVTETAPGVFATTRATVRYAAFGLEIHATGSAPTGRRFAGMQDEGASGLVHMGARHYDPRIGAFLQPDPLGIAAVQTYAYAANNPYRFVDPSGLDPQSIAGYLGVSFSAGGSGFDSSDASGSIIMGSSAASAAGGLGSGAGSSFSRPQFNPSPVPLLDAQRPCGGAPCDSNSVNSAFAVSLPFLAGPLQGIGSGLIRAKEALGFFPTKPGVLLKSGEQLSQPFSRLTGQFVSHSKTFTGKIQNALTTQAGQISLQFGTGFQEGLALGPTNPSLPPAATGVQRTGQFIGFVAGRFFPQ